MKIIGHVESGFIEKFGIPRQSGLVEEVKARVVFEAEYRTWDAFKGLEEYSHIWILWQFSQAQKKNWSATVKPPRLGGNQRMGVFATRSPFRPNSIGLSCVKLEKIEKNDKLGTILYISGADMVNGTPVYDIKPYLPYTDSRMDAVGGFADRVKDYRLHVKMGKKIMEDMSEEERLCIEKLIEQDPRPSYIEDEKRVYGVSYGRWNVKFVVKNDEAEVISVEKLKEDYKRR